MARTKQTAKKSHTTHAEEVRNQARMRMQLATKRARVQPAYKELPPVKLAQKRYHKKGN